MSQIPPVVDEIIRLLQFLTSLEIQAVGFVTFWNDFSILFTLKKTDGNGIGPSNLSAKTI